MLLYAAGFEAMLALEIRAEGFEVRGFRFWRVGFLKFSILSYYSAG